MEKIFYPESIVVVGLSSKPTNISRVVLDNLLRWGYQGRIFGLNPKSEDRYLRGVKIYRSIAELPEVPDLAVLLIPARLIPDQVEACGKFGIKRMAISSGGFTEYNEAGDRLSHLTLKNARKHGVRFVGPNALTVANTVNGLCLPFLPFYKPPIGGVSIISQSGGIGAIMLGMFMGENIGMAKFASIGNKVDLDEIDFLEYFGSDPDTKIICIYLESISRGRELIEVAAKIEKPIILLKANTSSAGKKVAMSHTAALSNDEDIVDAAMDEAGIIRVRNFCDFAAMAKAFKLPPMRGKRIMVMSPAGGFSVLTADLCEHAGFDFADLGKDFYRSLKKHATAGVIKLSNPLDMGDLYDPKMIAEVFYAVMNSENVDGAVYVSEWPHMPEGDDVFTKMFKTDISEDIWKAMVSSGKPAGICLFGMPGTLTQIKKNVKFPVFDNPEEMIRAMAAQRGFYAQKTEKSITGETCEDIGLLSAKEWIDTHKGIRGEESLELLKRYGIPVSESWLAKDEAEAMMRAKKIGYPLVMKIASPDALHKSEANGVMVGINDDKEATDAFHRIKKNLYAYKPDAEFNGVRLQKMAPEGFDMFIGGKQDESFGPVVFFGFGGLYVEVFQDVSIMFCPASHEEIFTKVEKLKSYAILSGARGRKRADIQGYIEAILRVSHLMADFPQIRELDINPLRVLSENAGVLALDARMETVDMDRKS